MSLGQVVMATLTTPSRWTRAPRPLRPSGGACVPCAGKPWAVDRHQLAQAQEIGDQSAALGAAEREVRHIRMRCGEVSVRNSAVVLDLAAIAGKVGTPSVATSRGPASTTWQPMHQRSASLPPTSALFAAATNGISPSAIAAIAIVLCISFTVGPNCEQARSDRNRAGCVTDVGQGLVQAG